MRHFKDFPDIAIPTQIESWEDHSWHNDAAAHCQYPLEDGSGIVFWVAPEKRSEREYPEFPRYLVEYQPDIAEWTDSSRRSTLYEGEDIDQAMATVTSFLVARRQTRV